MAQPTEEEINNMSPEQVAEMQKQNCIFCKIIAGEIPSKKVYEDNDFIGILDINPATQGHVLIIPKKHFQILPQIPQDLVGKLGVAAKNVSDKVLKAFQSDGTSVFIANGMVAGQKAPHFILHVIPRNENDSVPLNPEIVELNESDFSDTVKKIKTGLGVHLTPPPSQEEPQKAEKPSEEDSEPKEQEDPSKSESIDGPNADSAEDENETDSEDSDDGDDNQEIDDEDNDDTNNEPDDKDSNEEVDLDKIAKMFT